LRRIPIVVVIVPILADSSRLRIVNVIWIFEKPSAVSLSDRQFGLASILGGDRLEDAAVQLRGKRENEFFEDCLCAGPGQSPAARHGAPLPRHLSRASRGVRQSDGCASIGDGFGEAAHQVSARRDHRYARDAIEAKKSDPEQIAHAAETHG
jgi:hypothetical protein